MSLADYLAKNYLTADASTEKKSKKRKRKHAATETNGLAIADDDLGWNNISADHDDEDGPLQVTGRSAEFRKSKRSAWTTVGAPAPSNADQAAADAIIASAAAESKAHHEADDEAPTIANDGDDGVVRMASGAKAGLQTAEEVTRDIEARKAAELKAYAEMDPEASGQGQETIYRDASGRIINVAMKRAEVRRKAEEEARKKREEEEAAKGDVQRAQKEKMKQQLADAKFMTVARYADDADLNDELREQERWNDPAAQFLSNTKKKGKSTTGKPLYQGSAAPNRYGIRPGYRWDGVDRSNGAEKEYFAARNKRRDVENLKYAWEMDE